jgi:hypothetical protein
MRKSFFTAILLLVATTSLFAQSYFEGEVSYKLKYSDVSPELREVMDMFPTSLKLQIKGTQSRTEQEIPNVGKKITVEDSQMGTAFILIEAMDQKLATNVPPRVIEEANSGNTPGIQKVKGDEIEILGYKCEKVKVYTGEGQEVEIYYTQRIPASAYSEFSYLDGFPLKYTMKDGDFTLEVTAVEIKEQQLSDDLFWYGDEFTNLSYEEFIGLNMPGY